MVGKTLTRADLAEVVHRDIGLSRTESADMVNVVLDLVADALVDGSSVKLSSFGTFMIKKLGVRTLRKYGGIGIFFAVSC